MYRVAFPPFSREYENGQGQVSKVDIGIESVTIGYLKGMYMYRVGDNRLTKRYVYVQSRIYVCTTTPATGGPVLALYPPGCQRVNASKATKTAGGRQRRQRRMKTDQVKVTKASDQDAEGIVSSTQVVCIVNASSSVQVTCIIRCV